MPNFLVNDWRAGSGGQCVAYIYNNASPSQLGDPFGTTVGAIYPQAGRSFNGIIQFQGEIYAVARDGVYKKDDPTSATGGWTDLRGISMETPGVVRFNGEEICSWHLYSANAFRRLRRPSGWAR